MNIPVADVHDCKNRQFEGNLSRLSFPIKTHQGICASPDYMKLQIDECKWNGFDFYCFYFLDRINQSSLKLRPGTQDYQVFFRLRRAAFWPKADLS